jgi:hypothetical protein
MTTTTAVDPPKKQTFDLNKTMKRALGGGLAGASAMVIQVFTLMPLRTAMNYQYRFGGQQKDVLQLLYKEGGIRRFYRGLAPALLQGPLSRFGDTAANAGILALLESDDTTKNLPIAVKTIAASASSACFRILLTPIDTLKTTLQTTGKDGISILRQKVRVNGVGVMWYGALASASATFIGHYPWFATYNYLQETIPKRTDTAGKLARNAFIGFTASVTSDCISNSVRVVKTYRQTHTEKISYPQIVKNIVKSDGIVGLMGRGLKTRILTNGLQGIMFSVLWKFFEEVINGPKIK